MTGLPGRERVYKALQILTALSALIVYVGFLAVFFVVALVIGGERASDVWNGPFGYLAFWLFLVPLFLIHAIFFVFCKATGMAYDDDARWWFYLWLTPFPFILLALIKAENFGEATYVGMYMWVVAGGALILGWNLYVLGVMVRNWLRERSRRTR